MRRVERDKETEAGSLAPRALLLIWRRTSALEMWSGTPMLLLMYLQNSRILSTSVAPMGGMLEVPGLACVDK